MKQYAWMNLKQEAIMFYIFKGFACFEQLSQENNLKKMLVYCGSDKQERINGTEMPCKELCK